MKGSLVAATGAAFSRQLLAQSAGSTGASGGVGDIVDTNVHLFGWPFRNLKYGETDKLVAKLRQHGIRQAWAGSFEALLHKDIDGVNRRLVDACRQHRGFLIPFGAVNPLWPGWEEDLRRCHETYRMPGIRLHPSYQGYELSHPDFARLMLLASERRMLVQIVIELEDERVHHPKMITPDTNPLPVVDLLKELPRGRVQFLNFFGVVRGDKLKAIQGMLSSPQVLFDIANLEGAGALQKALAGEDTVGLQLKVPLKRLAFGSHAPYFPIQNSLFKFMESRLESRDLTAIMSGNAARFMAPA